MTFVLWLFEIGYLLQHIATVSQILRIQRKRSTEMVSVETNIMFLIGAIARLAWMWDSMLKGFFLAYLEVAAALATLTYIIYLYYKNKRHSFYQEEIKIPKYIRLEVLLPIILVLSFLFHPGQKNAYYLSMQMFVSLNIYSEAIGLLPQLFIIKQEKDTGNLSQFYAVFLGIARFFRLLFWVKMYVDGNKFMSLIIADLIHCLLLFDFVYNVIKNWNQGMLPTFGSDSISSKRIE